MLNTKRIADEGTQGGAAVPAPKWQGKRVGRFKLMSKLGQGAMGQVFLSEDTLMHRYAALKVLPKIYKKGTKSIALDRMFHEARAAATLDHPNVITIYEVNEASGGMYYIAMELMEGGSLKDLVKGAGPLEFNRACMLAADAAEALAHAHSMGIVHRDVKPANLMLSRSGRCKVGDFGLARIEEAGDLSGGMSESCGTPQFIAPELLRGQPASAASDIYSLGATLWFLLTGHPPFEAKTAGELLRKHLEAPLPDLAAIRPELPAPLVQAVQTALAKQPNKRFNSAEQFAKILRVHTIPVENSSTSLADVVEPAPPAEQAPAPKRNLKPWWIAGAVAAVAVLGLVLVPLLGGKAGKDAGTAGNGTVASAAKNKASGSGTTVILPDAPSAAAQSSNVVQPVAHPAPAEKRIDLLAGLDVDAATVKGNWHFEGKDLVSDSSGPAILELPEAVPDEYDFRIEFTPQDCAQQLLYKPKGPGQPGVAFNWCMNVGELSGFESIHGKHLFDEGAPTQRHYIVRPGTRHISVVHVRKDKVSVSVDGNLEIEYKTDYGDLSRQSDWFMRSNDKLGLGTWNKPTRFHKVELINKTGADDQH